MRIGVKMPLLSIVIPAFDEGQRIAKTLDATLDYLDLQTYSSEILVVDDGSRDNTIEVVSSFHSRAGSRLRVIRNPGNRGKGYSVRHGMQSAKGDIGLFFDADLATPPGEIPKVIDPIREGRFDVVFGSRALDKSLIGTHQSFFREAIGRTGNLLQRALTGLAFKDTQCGFKAFSRAAIDRVFPLQQIEGFGFDPEVLYIAKKHGFRLLEVPVRWNHVEGSKIHVIGTPLKVLLEVASIRFNNLAGKYNQPEGGKYVQAQRQH
jgi:glycosyltransferase involved in cell wall biosynthesis